MSYGTNGPFGLRPFSSLSGGAWVEKYNPYYIYASPDGLTTLNANIFTGDIVQWNTAAPAGGTIRPTIGGTGVNPIGVFAGCEYRDANNALQIKPNWVANTVVYPGTSVKCKVIDDTNVIWEVQVSTSDNTLVNAQWIQQDMGKNAAFAVGGGGDTLIPNNPAAGNSVTGVSAGYLDGTTKAVTATLPLKALGFVETPANNPKDINGNSRAFLNLRVILNVHSYKSVGTLGILAV